jgi:VanZ family protein
MANNYFNLKWLTIATLFIAIVILLTHIPQEVLPTQLQRGGLDKIEHIAAYGAITILFVLSLKARGSVLSASFLFFAILAVATFDEFTQPFFNRTASFIDWVTNIVGIITVLLSFILL